MKTAIRVKTAHPYEVIIGEDFFTDMGRELKKRNLNANVFAVIDRNSYEYHKDKINLFLDSCAPRPKKMILTPAESLKTFATVEKILGGLIRHKFNRDAVIIAIGGGIVGDISGFAASAYTRGIKYVNIPTTLLAAVDSSIGGKTGVNVGRTKNIAGAFHNPELVLIDTQFLDTLPKAELICGLGETLKYVLLMDDKYFEFMKRNLKKIVSGEIRFPTAMIEEFVKFKISVVEKDEKETAGLRKILNLGHTFAHPLETIHDHKIKHGEAVVFGLIASLHLSHRLNYISTKALEKFLVLFQPIIPEITIPRFNFNDYYGIMKLDKKNRNGRIKFVCLTGIGRVLIDIEAKRKDVFAAVEKSLEKLNKKNPA